MEIGQKIYEIRKQEGLSQEEFARKFHVTRQAVSNWENGKNYPDLKTLLQISEVYDITFDELIRDDTDLIDSIDRDRKSAPKGSIALAVLWTAVIMAATGNLVYHRMVKEKLNMEQFLENHALGIGLIAGLLVAVFGLVWTVLERKLIVSRKHVTGVSGFTSAMAGAALTAGSVYLLTEDILWFALALAVFILAYATICLVVVKKEYAPEERYTKE